MTQSFNGNALWHLVQQSDALTKFILLALFFMNVICTTIFLYKFVLLRLKNKEIKKALHALHHVHSIDELRVLVTEFALTWPGHFLKKTLTFVKNSLEKHPELPLLSQQEFEHLEGVMGQTIEDMMHAEQTYTSILSSSAAVSPLIGLFGTVWGLVHAFVRISQRQSADISTVAPGIAEALITTLAGLCVAIPVLMMYHYVITKNKNLEHQLVSLADRTFSLTQKFFGNGFGL